MKALSALILIILVFEFNSVASVIRINQLGYIPNSVKVAVFISPNVINCNDFQVYESISNKLIFTGKPEKSNAQLWGMKTALRLDFSSLNIAGSYYISVCEYKSAYFRIDNDVYKGTADFVLNYMRQQRCGYNPYLKDSCHLHDGIIVDHPTKSGDTLDVTGGWHDASDYLQYTTTSANAIYQMLFAWQKNPVAFKDNYLANGLPGKNGIPDILDEAKFGLQWLLKMNPENNEYYNQIADDRDHSGYRLPTADTLGGYGLGKYRPVYFVTGKPQGLGKYKNRSTGISSTVAKFASSFAIGAKVFSEFDVEFSARLLEKALEAYNHSLTDLGNCQTASMVSPYFYEEENYVDDLQLAAASLIAFDTMYEKDAKYWGELEPITPWMELNRARHYQFYPFINLGHYLLGSSSNTSISEQFTENMRQGLLSIQKYAEDDPFRIGVPFIWCSNNLVVAAATQARLYREISKNNEFEKIEAALTDWLFGCNPWGTSMICGLPAGGDFPEIPHSSLTYILKKTTTGGLVDGPVYSKIYNSLIGISLLQEDEYADFQHGKAVYHDDMGDYSTNEPTMDGTASLSYLLSSLETEAKSKTEDFDSQGAIIRFDRNEKKVFLIFSADEFNEGGNLIRSTLEKHKVKSSFFFTGKFYENKSNEILINNLIKSGHYLGAHSDQHLLYADWKKRDSTLVSKSILQEDIKANYKKMKAFDILPNDAQIFLPPFEWYNSQTVDWCQQLGLKVINFTPGIKTNADYTTPEMKNYKSSDELMKDLKVFEKNNKEGLNGCIILIHLGTSDLRTDKFYNRLDEMIRYLKSKNYLIERF